MVCERPPSGQPSRRRIGLDPLPTLDGFVMLRFTNEEIDDDPARVLAGIESLLETTRTEEGNLA